jgi:hypothetical protein
MLALLESVLTESVNDFSRYPKLPSDLVRNARVLPDRLAALPLWPTGATIVEVGVALGGFTAEVLNVCRPRRFIAIDRFDLHELDTLWGQPTRELFANRTQRTAYEARFAAEIASGTLQVIQGDSAPSIASLPDDSVDVFYVDADHRYAGVRADLEALRPKVKADGWVVMNDYIPADTFSQEPMGVIQATNEFMIEHGWEMAYFAFAPVMYCDVGLRRAGQVGPVRDQSAELRAAEARVRAAEARTHFLEAALTSAKSDAVQDARARIEGAEARAHALEAALAATRRSTSWKVTAPLRALSSRLLRRRA